MLATYTRLAALAALLTTTTAQKDIPSDLSAGFEPDSLSFQVSYTGDAENGFPEDTVFPKSNVTNEPTFAFTDSSGISTASKYLIVLLDVTCTSARTLHYARPNFQYDYNITGIASNATALQAYKAPGAFGEQGQGRQYAFLFYAQPGNEDIASLKLPKEGEVFEVKGFQDGNGLLDSVAGVGMQVDLGGSAGCGGAASTGAGAVGTAAASSGGAATGSVGGQGGGSAATPAATSATPSVHSGATSASSGLVAATTKLVGGSQTTRATKATGSAGSGTASATAAAATETGAASGLSLATAKCGVVAALMAFAALLAF